MRLLGRREFLRGTLAAGAAAAVGTRGRALVEKPIPRRALGRAGVEVSALGLGCAPIGGLRDHEGAVRLIRAALDAGIDYVDTAPSYGEGVSERRVGEAMRGRRDSVFVATKTLERGRKEALRELEESLRRLETDRVDLWQVHEVRSLADVEGIAGRGGVLEAFEAAKKEGKARFLGFTGHKDPLVLRAMLERFAFDAVLFPLNVADPHWLPFVRDFLPAAVGKGLGLVAMKVFAGGALARAREVTQEECLRYTLDLPVSTAIVGFESKAELDAALAVARSLRPLGDRGRETLSAKAAPLRGRGSEWYKVEVVSRG